MGLHVWPTLQPGSGGAGGIVQASTVTLTSGDLTTSSTTFVDATGLTLTLTTGAHQCLVVFSASGHNSVSGDNVATDLDIDGARQGGDYGLIVVQGSGSVGANTPLGFTYLTSALTAASHTFKIKWRVDGVSTGTLFASATVTPAILTVIELGI